MSLRDMRVVAPGPERRLKKLVDSRAFILDPCEPERLVGSAFSGAFRDSVSVGVALLAQVVVGFDLRLITFRALWGIPQEEGGR